MPSARNGSRDLSSRIRLANQVGEETQKEGEQFRRDGSPVAAFQRMRMGLDERLTRGMPLPGFSAEASAYRPTHAYYRIRALAKASRDKGTVHPAQWEYCYYSGQNYCDIGGLIWCQICCNFPDAQLPECRWYPCGSCPR